MKMLVEWATSRLVTKGLYPDILVCSYLNLVKRLTRYCTKSSSSIFCFVIHDIADMRFEHYMQLNRRK